MGTPFLSSINGILCTTHNSSALPIRQEQHARLKHLSSLGTIRPVQQFSSPFPGTSRHVHHSLHWEQYDVSSPPLSFEIIHRAQHFSVPLGQYFMYVHHLSKSEKYVKYHMLFCCTSCKRMYKIYFLGTAPMLRTPFLSTVENTQGSLSVRIGAFPFLTGALSLLSEKSKPCASLLYWLKYSKHCFAFIFIQITA